jgi:hypothetical protein
MLYEILFGQKGGVGLFGCGYKKVKKKEDIA